MSIALSNIEVSPPTTDVSTSIPMNEVKGVNFIVVVIVADTDAFDVNGFTENTKLYALTRLFKTSISCEGVEYKPSSIDSVCRTPLCSMMRVLLVESILYTLKGTSADKSLADVIFL